MARPCSVGPALHVLHYSMVKHRSVLGEDLPSSWTVKKESERRDSSLERRAPLLIRPPPPEPRQGPQHRPRVEKERKGAVSVIRDAQPRKHLGPHTLGPQPSCGLVPLLSERVQPGWCENSTAVGAIGLTLEPLAWDAHLPSSSWRSNMNCHERERSARGTSLIRNIHPPRTTIGPYAWGTRGILQEAQ